MAWARYLVVTGVAAALAGCGGDTDEPDVDEIMRELGREVQEQTGTEDVEVICSEDVSEGDLCDVTAPGGLKARVRVVRLDGDEIEGEIVQP